MTKKDFNLIAEVIRGMRSYTRDDVLSELSVRLSDRLGETNALFNTERFLSACRGEDSTDSAGRKVRYSRETK